MSFVVGPSAVTRIPVVTHSAPASSAFLGWFPVRRVYCVGLNYKEHGIEVGIDQPPLLFFKNTDNVLSPPLDAHGKCSVPYPPYTKEFHYECELVACIGKSGANVTAAEAEDLIYGYAVGLDLTRRDVQNNARKISGPWDLSKCFDYSAPIGHIIPKENLPHDISQAKMDFRVNGVVKQSVELSKLIWSVPQIIAKISEQATVQPGDIIFTGTPRGIGPLVPGDVCTAEITGLPSLEVTIEPLCHGIKKSNL
jgi:fumarylpyruvate hydrolase